MRTPRLPYVFFLLLIFSSLHSHAADAAKGHTAPDVLLFTNGDQLTGKLLHSTGTNLTFHSDMAGDITISWSKVKQLRSERQFVVLGKDKHWSWRAVHDVPTGSITVQDEKIQLKTDKKTQVIPIKDTADVLDLDTFNQEAVHEVSFFRRWTGAVNLGTTLIEATQHTTSINGGASLVRNIPSVNYLPPQNRTTMNFSGSYSIITQPQAAGAPTLPNVETAIFHADAERDEYVSERFYLLAQTAFDHNYSQGLDLQQVYGAGVGWTVLKQTSQTLDLKATLQYEKQQFLASVEEENTNLFGSTFSINYMRKLPLKAVFTQQAQYLPAYNHPYAYSAYESNNLTFPLWKRLGFTLGTVDSYLNNPAPALYPAPLTRKNSLQFTTGISYTLK